MRRDAVGGHPTCGTAVIRHFARFLRSVRRLEKTTRVLALDARRLPALRSWVLSQKRSLKSVGW